MIPKRAFGRAKRDNSSANAPVRLCSHRGSKRGGILFGKINAMWVAAGLAGAVVIGFLASQGGAATANGKSSVQDKGDVSSSSKRYVATLTCRMPDGTPVLVMGCLQGDGGSLKINNGSDVRQYTDYELGMFAENERTFQLSTGYKILASVQYNTVFILRLEVKDSDGNRVFADEASKGGVILASD